mmetsp:Transcript_27919/g.51475  ORF Transcript_27919/g.51475 Transcript_27919/m.51475 type:complete len:384 (+) Transcript_27919:69-1220(+)
MAPRSLPLATFVLLFIPGVHSLSTPKHKFNRREYLHAFGKTLVVTPFAIPSISNAITSDDQQGIAAVTDSQIGRAFRKSVVQSAQVVDKLDGGWERFSDSLRDKSKCDKNTGRRLYDNGTRKDGTPIGSPGLGELCAPEPLSPLDVGVKDSVLAAAVKSALIASGDKGGTDTLLKAIQESKDLVRPSFERSMKNSVSEDEKNRGLFKFELYSTLRAITNFLKGDKSSIRAFQLAWGNELISMYAPSANRKDYVSPFPDKDEEFADFDYDKNLLFDALGTMTVTLDRLKSGGLLGVYEITIPYDDYGSVVTVALDDYTSIGAEILLSEQNILCDGPIQALTRALFDRARINIKLNTFFMDPSTTSQDDYSPSQLLLSLNGLSKM